LIITEIARSGKQSFRKLASLINRSKSSVHRHEQARVRRNQHPESVLWETDSGEAWQQMLVLATLYTFGMECHVGADKLAKFFKLIRMDTHVGTSPSTIRKQLNKIEELLPLFQQGCESDASTQSRRVVVAADETFFGDFLILVLMDLSSGYLILEDISDDRCFDTWLEKAAPRLEALGIDVNHAISDRAKALIKLAITGFECQSGADTFHAQYDVSKWLGAKLGRLNAQAKKRHEAALQTVTKQQECVSTKALSGLAEQALHDEKACVEIQKTLADYHENLPGISDEIHPFSLQDNQPNDTERVLSGLEKRAQAFEKIAQSQDIDDSRQTMKKFRNQFDDLAVNVEFWWLWVTEILTGLAVDEVTQHWLTHTLLPVVYWHQQLQKTKNPKQREKYKQAWQRAVHDLQTDSFSTTLPESEMQRWLAWAEWMVQKFHRSSSAVEGRNGYLSQMYHNGRGLTEKRLRALTVIHNYGLKRLDGTTAAVRLFGREFPDLFSWLVTEMGQLPLPRKGGKRVVHNPLFLITVPA